MEKLLIQYGISSAMLGDILFFLILAAIGIALGFLIGRYRLMALLASVYFSSALFAVIPGEYIPKDPTYILAAFTVLVLVLTFLDEYLFDVNAEVAENVWRGVIVGFLAVGVFVSAAVALVPWSALSGIISRETYGYLAGPWARVFWMVIPLLFLFIVKRKWR